MVETGGSVEQARQALGIEQVGSDALVALCRELLAANPHIVQDVKNGKQQAIGALIGQARKRNPNANPGARAGNLPGIDRTNLLRWARLRYAGHWSLVIGHWSLVIG